MRLEQSGEVRQPSDATAPSIDFAGLEVPCAAPEDEGNASAEAPAVKKEGNATNLQEVFEEKPAAEGNGSFVAPVVGKDGNATNLQEVLENNASLSEPEALVEEKKEDEIPKKTIGGDAIGVGVQRLVEVKESDITVSASYNTRYYYSSNPEKVRNGGRQDVTLWENGLSVNVGLGQLVVLDHLVTPSLMVMHMRIWTDPGKHHGAYFRLYDVDSQSANLSFNVELAEGWSVNLGYGESRALAYRDDVVSVTTQTPTVAFTKMIPVGESDMLMINVGTAYNFNTGDTVDFPALNLLIPEDGSDMLATNFNLNYMRPVAGIEKLMVSPSLGVSHSYYTNTDAMPVPSKGRQDWVLNYGFNATYQLTDTVSIQAFGMYSKKTFNGYGKNTLNLGPTEYKNFDAGVGISASYNF
ncbi:MAG: hypothetical protein CMI32_06925 [Opitutales bacterium]|nr:hypothetical protein [Opitutales bacterium]